MASFTSIILSILIALFAGAVAFAWYTDTLKPTVVYYYTYLTEGRKKAEETALDMFGESKLSYGLKGEFESSWMMRILLRQGPARICFYPWFVLYVWCNILI